MKRLLLTVIYILIKFSLFAQVHTSFLYGSWVKCKISNIDGSELPDDNPQKYAFLKYTFTKPNRISVSVIYFAKGKTNEFELSDNKITIKSPEGGYVNSLHISTIGDTLILQQFFTDNSRDGIKFYMVREQTYQNSIPLTSSDIRSINGKDTVYRESHKIYAKFKDPSFEDYTSVHVGEDPDGKRIVGHLVASFIVSETGVADSLKILESISPEFDKRFVRAFNKTKNEWEPATLRGKNVKVQMMTEIRYLGFEGTMPAYFDNNKGNEAYNEKNYDLAIYYYDKALQNNPADRGSLVKRGICKEHLGNKQGACEDWNKAKTLGGVTEDIEALLGKYCQN